MRVLKLFLASLSTISCASCITTPGMDEPIILVYVIKSDGTGECMPKDICPKPFKTAVEMIGYQAVSPNSVAKINSHHEILHRELNSCKGVE